MGLLSMFSIGATDVPVGAQADVKELEYIIALMQTSLPDIRSDATVSATDVRLFLRSRYGLDVKPEVAIDIVRGLGGETSAAGTTSGTCSGDGIGGGGAMATAGGHGDDDTSSMEHDLRVPDTPPLPSTSSTDDNQDDDDKEEGEEEEEGKDDAACSEEDICNNIGVSGRGHAADADSTISNQEKAVQKLTQLDEEMGLFGSAVSTELASFVDGEDGCEGSMSRRSSSVFFDAAQSMRSIPSDIGDDEDYEDDDNKNHKETVEEMDEADEKAKAQAEADSEVEAETVGEAGGASVADLPEQPPERHEQQSIGTTSKSAQWSNRFPNKRKGLGDVDAVAYLDLDLDGEPTQFPSPPVGHKEEYLDLVHLLGALLIPSLIKAKREADIANGIIPDEDDVPANPELSFYLFFCRPIQFFHSVQEANRLKKKRIEKALRDSLRVTPRRLMRDALLMLVNVLRPAQGSKHVGRKGRTREVPKIRRLIIDEVLIRSLLLAFGEEDAAEDDELVHEMMIVAGGEGAVLDELAFAKALTSDVLAWNCGMEDNMSEVS